MSVFSLSDFIIENNTKIPDLIRNAASFLAKTRSRSVSEMDFIPLSPIMKDFLQLVQDYAPNEILDSPPIFDKYKRVLRYEGDTERFKWKIQWQTGFCQSGSIWNPEWIDVSISILDSKNLSWLIKDSGTTISLKNASSHEKMQALLPLKAVQKFAQSDLYKKYRLSHYSSIGAPWSVC